MGNFQSISNRFVASRTPDEEEGESTAYANLQNQYKPNGDSSEKSSLKILLSYSSIYKATKALLLKLCLVFNYSSPRKTAHPLLPIQNPASSEPLLIPTPLIFSRRSSDDSSSHSILKIKFGSLTYSSGIDDEEDRCENQRDRESVVSAPEVRWSNEIEEEIAPQNPPCVEESVGIYSSREGEAKKQGKKSIVVVGKKKRIKHYSSRHKTLLVGEGDFSFSACLAVAFGSAANITATSLDSEAFLKKHYANAMSNISELRNRGGKVMHGIDATEIAKNELLGQVKYDRIIFNFPFAGFFHKLPTESQLRRHRRLVSQFLMNAKKMITENGEIHILHKTNGIHAEFNVERIASSHGLRLIQAVKFKCSHYPGYNTKYGFGGDSNFNCYPSKTFKFGLKTASLS